MSVQGKALGAAGEELAARWYRRNGYEIVARNWRCREGELDIVAARGRTLVVCEVKTRTSVAFGSPLEGISEVKANRLRRLAELWMERFEVRPTDVRIDLVGVLVPRGDRPVVDHVRGAE